MRRATAQHETNSNANCCSIYLLLFWFLSADKHLDELLNSDISKVEIGIGSWATEEELQHKLMRTVQQWEGIDEYTRACVWVSECVYSLWAMIALTHTDTLHMIAICNFLAIKIDKILLLAYPRNQCTWWCFFSFGTFMMRTRKKHIDNFSYSINAINGTFFHPRFET